MSIVYFKELVGLSIEWVATSGYECVVETPTCLYLAPIQQSEINDIVTASRRLCLLSLAYNDNDFVVDDKLFSKVQPTSDFVVVTLLLLQFFGNTYQPAFIFVVYFKIFAPE